jgi:hypothetical protein
MKGGAMGKKRIPNPCSVVRENPHPGHGTVLVLGTPRGGTSVVSGICHMLGVPMGVEIDRSNMEDLRFRGLLKSESRAELASVYLRELQALGQIVGAKDPVAIDHLSEVYPRIPQPILVVVSRDVYASTQREVAEGHEFWEILRATIRRKYSVLDFISTVDDPLIVVSYERLMQDSVAAVQSLARFLVGAVPERLVRLTAGMVQPHADMPHDIDFVAARLRYEQEIALSSGSIA